MASDSIVFRDAHGLATCDKVANPFLDGWTEYDCRDESNPLVRTVFRATIGGADDPHPLPSLVCATGVSIDDDGAPAAFARQKAVCTLSVPGAGTWQAPVKLDAFVDSRHPSHRSALQVLETADWALCGGRDCPQPVHPSNPDAAECFADKSPAGAAYGWDVVATTCGLDGAASHPRGAAVSGADCDAPPSSTAALLCRSPGTDVYTHLSTCDHGAGTWAASGGGDWVCRA